MDSTPKRAGDAATEARSRVTLRYVPEFRCLAGDCKENCCAGLRVELSEASHAHLVARAAGTSLETRVEELVVLEPPATRTTHLHAYVDAGGKACPFLASDWLCEIHRTLGEDALADPCSLFPRVLAEVDGRRELAATFACPETARLCLTMPGAVDFVPLEEGVMAREIVVRRHDATSKDPYVARFEEVRQICLDVMRREGIGGTVGLLAVADFAERVGSFFHAGTTTFSADALRAAALALPERIAAIRGLVVRTPIADARAVRALEEMFIARLPNCDNARFNALIRPLVLAEPNAENARLVSFFDHEADPRARSADGGTDVAIPGAILAERSRAARARLSPTLRARLDEHGRRYVINALVKDWYTSRPTLASSIKRLVLRLALSRFATLMHPSLSDLTPADPRGAEILDEAAVEAFQIIAKNVEHTPSFMEIVENYLGAVGLDSLEGLALLLVA